MKRLLICVILALVSVPFFASLASAKAPVEVKVSLTEFSVDMSTVDLPAGAAVTYIITNNGKVKHEMVLEKDGVVDEPLEFSGAAQEAENIEPAPRARSSGPSPMPGNISSPATSRGTMKPA